MEGARMDTIANRIRQGMEIRNMKQVDIIERTGINKGALSSYISGKYAPKQNNIYKIAQALDVNEAWLMGHDVPMERKKSEINTSNVTPINIPTDTITIKVYGSVPAGQPIEALEDIIGYEEIPVAWTRFGKEFIALVVKGDSMYPKYFEGDTVIIEVTPDCNNGQDAVVYVNGYDATLKEVHKNDDGSITLKPFNPEYPPKTYQPGKDGVTILGVVKELRRKM
jgi:SOS-response transcriptional repressors (RecA-mediated autopeptidases)